MRTVWGIVLFACVIGITGMRASDGNATNTPVRTVEKAEPCALDDILNAEGQPADMHAQPAPMDPRAAAIAALGLYLGANQAVAPRNAAGRAPEQCQYDI